MRDLAGRPQSRPAGRRPGMGAGPVQDAAGVVEAAGKLDRVAVGGDLLAAGVAWRGAPGGAERAASKQV